MINIKDLNLKSNPKYSDDLESLLKAIIEEYNPDKVVLFGSQARGDWHEHSDFDIAVINPKGGPFRVSKVARRMRAENRDIIFEMLPSKLEHFNTTNVGAMAYAREEGVVLYDITNQSPS